MPILHRTACRMLPLAASRGSRCCDLARIHPKIHDNDAPPIRDSSHDPMRHAIAMPDAHVVGRHTRPAVRSDSTRGHALDFPQDLKVGMGQRPGEHDTIESRRQHAPQRLSVPALQCSYDGFYLRRRTRLGKCLGARRQNEAGQHQQTQSAKGHPIHGASPIRL